MASTHAVLGPKPDYFNQENVRFIQSKVVEILRKEFRQNIIFDPASITSVMMRIYQQKLESWAKMNRRVVMELCRDFRNEQIVTNKHLQWGEHFAASQQVYDEMDNKGPDLNIIKKPNRLGFPKVGSTTQFVFY